MRPALSLVGVLVAGFGALTSVTTVEAAPPSRRKAASSASEPVAAAAPDPSPAAPMQLDQKYNGLAPGASASSPLPKPDLKTWGAKLMWTGFQMTPDGSRVFLQTSAPVEVVMKAEKRSAILTLRNCRVHLRNNKRDLDTRFFATPLRSLSVRQKRKDVEVHLGLKEAAATSPKVEAGPDGTTFVVLDLPPGKADTQAIAGPADSAQQGDSPAGDTGERAEDPATSKQGSEKKGSEL